MPHLVLGSASRRKAGAPVVVVDFFAGHGQVRENLVQRYGTRVPVEYHPVDPNLDFSKGRFETASRLDVNYGLPPNFRVVPHRHGLPIASPIMQERLFDETLGGISFDEVHAHMLNPHKTMLGSPADRAALLTRVARYMAPGASFYHTMDHASSPFVSLPWKERRTFQQVLSGKVTKGRRVYQVARAALEKQLAAAGLVLDQFIIREHAQGVLQSERIITALTEGRDAKRTVARAVESVTDHDYVPRILAFSAHKPKAKKK